MPRRAIAHAVLALVLLAGAALSGPARAWSIAIRAGDAPVRWETGLPIPLRVSQLGSDNLGPAASRAAIARALARWEAVGCAVVAFAVDEAADTAAPDATVVLGGPRDGQNDLVFVESGWTMGRYVLGVTAPMIGEHGIEEADIAFNGQDVIWTDNGEGGIDLEAVALHEVGHLLGLQHNLGPFNADRQPTMAPQIGRRAESRSLEEDDVRGICYLYPRDPEAITCADDDACGMILDHDAGTGDEQYGGRLHCGPDTGRCDVLERFIAGGSALGDRCGAPWACADGLWCQPTPGGPTCTRSCHPGGADCGAGFQCALGAGPFADAGVCLPATGEPSAPGTGPAGCILSATCAAGSYCLPTPADDRRLCVPLCRADDPGSCPEGARCQTYGGATGGCFDAALFPDDDPAGGDIADDDADARTGGDTAGDAGGDGLGADAAADGASAPGPSPRDGGGCAGGGAPPLGLSWPGLALAVAVWRRRPRRACPEREGPCHV